MDNRQIKAHIPVRRLSRDEIPKWLHTRSVLWMRRPSVVSVVLFGSRATGYASDLSDWDVAVLYDGLTPSAIRRRDDEEHKIHEVLIPMWKFREESHVVGMLAHEIARDGKVVAGWAPRILENHFETCSDTLARLVERALTELHGCVYSVSHVLKAANESNANRLLGRVESGHIPQVAKCTCQALCVQLGVGYKFVHDVNQLAKRVPSTCSKHVLALKHVAAKARMAREQNMPKLTIRDATAQIRHVARLLVEILPKCLVQLAQKNLVLLEIDVEETYDNPRTPLVANHPLLDDILDDMEYLRNLVGGRKLLFRLKSSLACD